MKKNSLITAIPVLFAALTFSSSVFAGFPAPDFSRNADSSVECQVWVDSLGYSPIRDSQTSVVVENMTFRMTTSKDLLGRTVKIGLYAGLANSAGNGFDPDVAINGTLRLTSADGKNARSGLDVRWKNKGKAFWGQVFCKLK